VYHGRHATPVFPGCVAGGHARGGGGTECERREQEQN